MVGGRVFSQINDYINSFHVDLNILYFYQIGLVIGLVIITTLVIFPGEPWDEDNLNTNKEEDIKNDEKSSSMSQRSNEREFQQKQDGQMIDNHNLQELLNETDSDSKITTISNRRPSKEQRQQDARRHLQESSEEERQTIKIMNPHQQLNTLIYIIIFTFMFYFLNERYDNIVLLWIIHLFPKEAEILGIGFQNKTSD